LLDNCVRYLDLAVQAPEKPPLAEVDTKIHFARGQCDWLKTYSGVLPDYNLAYEEFQQVVAAYGDGANPHVRELAAESHARIGLIYHLTENPAAAVKEYQMAIDLLPDFLERQAHLHSLIGLIYQSEGNLPAAANEYQIAADLIPDIPEQQALYQKKADEIRQQLEEQPAQ
jgi:tetratricopeptide (TPR) repeat protein